jgi:hypothetical protein
MPAQAQDQLILWIEMVDDEMQSKENGRKPGSDQVEVI